MYQALISEDFHTNKKQVIKQMFDDALIEELYDGCAKDFGDPVSAKKRQLGFEDSAQASGSGFFPDVRVINLKAVQSYDC